MTRPIVFLDLSRLVRRFADGGGPTGIDRIEMAYAHWLLRQERFVGVAVGRRGKGLAALRPGAVEMLIMALGGRWSGTRRSAPPAFARPMARAAGALRAQQLFARGPLHTDGAPSVYLNVGHDGLDEAARFDALPGAFAALISDVIPITHPEYDTPRATHLQRQRVATLAARADHVACVSAAARDALLSVSDGASYTTSVAHLAPSLAPQPRRPAERATFVHISSMDRRKNVPLLLHLWRDMAMEGGPVPRLVLIGRAGNDGTAAELIRRCEVIEPHLVVRGSVSDAQVAAALAEATALLSPSFVEGFGLPVIEARAAGVPVVASDIPSHREIGGADTIFCHPLDGPAWRAAIEQLAAERPEPGPAPLPDWDAHFATMEAMLAPLAR